MQKKIARGFFVGNRNETDINSYVVKFGSTVVVHEDGTFNSDFARGVAERIANARENGITVYTVSSGAMALGENCLDGNATDKEKALQGQELLRSGWEDAFQTVGLQSRGVLMKAGRLKRAVRQATSYVKDGLQPVINSDDAFNRQLSLREHSSARNNDFLGEAFAHSVGAHYLIVTSSGGVQTRERNVLPFVRHPNEIELFENQSQIGTGGMLSKAWAVHRIALRGRRAAIIGPDPADIGNFLQGNGVNGTLFISPLAA